MKQFYYKTEFTNTEVALNLKKTGSVFETTTNHMFAWGSLSVEKSSASVKIETAVCELFFIERLWKRHWQSRH